MESPKINTEKALVSVIIPAYNAAEYLPDAIQSVLQQNYRPIEVIVVDDGSTDNTREVVSRILAPEVVYYHKENGGASSARNFGIEKARGEYIRFVDADDFLMPEVLTKQMEHALSLDDKQISIGRYLSDGGEICTPQMHSMAAYPPWIGIYTKRALIEVGGFDTAMRIGEDLELTINLKTHGYSFVLMDEVVYQYCCGRNPNSLIIQSLNKKDWSHIRHVFKKHLTDYGNFTTFKEFYRFCIIHLYMGGNTSDYKYLRHELPFLVYPTQICSSRVLGYFLWYGSYIIPFDKLRSWLKNNVTPSFAAWLSKHRL